MNRGSRADHHRFCVNEGWETVKSATGGEVRHHVTFELLITDGRVLRTRISRPVNKTEYGAGLWSHILRDQLDVSEAEFWDCASKGVKPDRGPGEPPVPDNAMPAWMVAQLLAQGVPEAEVKQMDAIAGQARLADLWSRPQGA